MRAHAEFVAKFVGLLPSGVEHSTLDSLLCAAATMSDAVDEREVRETPGERVTVGHPSHELVYIMILGVRTAVSNTEPPVADTILTPADSLEVVRRKFVSDGTPKTPAHKHSDFKFQDYAPKTFQAIRSIFISEEDYLLSLTRDNVLSEMSSPGKVCVCVCVCVCVWCGMCCVWD